MNFSEAATEGVLWRKLFLKISQYSKQSCRPAYLLKRDFNTAFSSEDGEIFMNTYFEEHLLTAASAKQLHTEHQWAAASVLTLLLSSDK